jgi:hypothetical protein
MCGYTPWEKAVDSEIFLLLRQECIRLLPHGNLMSRVVCGEEMSLGLSRVVCVV